MDGDAGGGVATPARRRVLRALATATAPAPAPATVEEVAGWIGATSATVREHLDDLVLAELVRSAPGRSGLVPELEEGPEGAVVTFHHCPDASVALDHPVIICALHRGMADRILGGGVGAAGELDVRDPRAAGCRLHLVGPPA